MTRVHVPRPVPYEELLDVDALWVAEPVGDDELRRLQVLASDGDAEASFRVGFALARRLPFGQRDDADRWFARAVSLGGGTWAWLATDAYCDDPVRYPRWMARAIDAEYPRPDAPGVHVAPDTIRPIYASDWDMAPVAASFRVAEATDAVVAALGKASPRLTRVDERGREYASDEELMDAVHGEAAPLRPDGEARYTTGWTSDPLHDDAGGAYLLTKGRDRVWGPMARTMIRIVVDELLDAGVTEAHLGPHRP